MIWQLVGGLIGMAASKLGQFAASRGISIGIGIGGVAAGSALTIDELRQQATLLAGNTGPQGLEEAARMAARMLGLGGDRVLWPISNRTGQLIVPKYFHISLVQGRAWYTSTYVSSRRGRRFGGGFRRRWGGYGGGRWRGGGQGTTIVKQD